MDKSRLCYLLRSKYPKVLGIRMCLQRLKVKRLYNHVLPKQQIIICEQNPSKKEEVIRPYLSKWKKYLRPTIAEMEDILSNGPLFKDRTDKNQLRIDMMFCRLSYGFIPSEYVCFELENKTPDERKEYVSDIDMNVFGYSVNDITVLQGILDKGDSYYRFKEYFKRDAIVVEKRKDFADFHAFIKKHPIFVKKVVFSSMGRGIELVNIQKKQKSEKEYFEELIRSGKYLLEECVVQHPEMGKFNPSSVNTVRCFTFKTNRGIEIPWSFMRTGRNGSFVDNGGAGGLVIGIDPKTGRIITDGYDEYNDSYKKHPDTGIVFIGSKIPEWNDLISLCSTAAAKVDGMGYLSWDLAFTENGWVVIEVNEVGQFIGPQMTMKKGIKAELEEYSKRMTKVI